MTVLVLRHLEALGDSDRQKLLAFGKETQCPGTTAKHLISWWLQSLGPDTVHPLDVVAWTIPYLNSGITMPFKPTDFTQVNHAINQIVVGRALRLLDEAG